MGDLHLPGQKRQRRAQIAASLGGHAGDGVIRGNIKPCGLSVNQEQILFRALVFPAHSPRPPEVRGPRFGANNPSVLGIALEKSGLQGFGSAVSRFQARRKCPSFPAACKRREKQDESAKHVGHAASLAGKTNRRVRRVEGGTLRHLPRSHLLHAPTSSLYREGHTRSHSEHGS